MTTTSEIIKPTIIWHVETNKIDYSKEIARQVTWDEDGNGITFHECYLIRDDKGKITDRQAIASVKLSTNTLPDEIKADCLRHGLSQKCGDATASMSYGKGHKVGERLNVVAEIYEGLAKGNWSNRAQGTSTMSAAEKAEAKELLSKRYLVALQIIKGEVAGAVAHFAMESFKITDAMLEQIAKSNGLDWDGIASNTDNE